MDEGGRKKARGDDEVVRDLRTDASVQDDE